MSKLDDLVNKLCPNGVDFKELGAVCQFKNGFSFKSELFQDQGEPIIRITNISNGYVSNKDIVYFNSHDYDVDLKSYIVDDEDIVVAMSGATTGKIGMNKTGIKFYLYLTVIFWRIIIYTIGY